MIVLVLLAALQFVPAGRCKKTFVAGSASQFIGRASWSDEAQNTIVGSTEDRTVGRSVLTCAVKLPSKSNRAVLDLGGARITFDGKDAAGGLEIAAAGGGTPVCTISGVRISRENWMELGPAVYDLRFNQPVDRVNLVFTLIDTSPNAAIRADINPVVIRPLRSDDAPLPCPPSRSPAE